MQLRIGLPHIKNIGLKSRLEADIELPNGEVKTLYYEVESQYEKYLCTDRSDAFLISLLQYAMFYGYNITWDCPVTERLFYQLNTMYIPVLAEVANDHSFIKMEGALVNTDIEKSTHCVATGASGGIDSFYTIMRHLTDVEESYRLTHLFYVAISNNVTSLGNLRKEFENGYKIIDKIAKELKLPIVTLFSNEAEFYYNGIVTGGALRYAGMVYALEKLFSIYYLSSSYSFADMKIKKGDSSTHYDLFNLFCVSTKNIQFYSTGGEKGRSEKTSYIENFNVVKKYLHVCNFNDVHNCSICDKCFRTMLALYADGVLEDFQDVFDLEKFHKYKKKYMARMVYRKSKFDNEIIKKFKVNNKEIPVCAKIKGIAIRPIYLMWQKLQKNRFFMKLFYKTKLDYVLYSKEMADSIRYCNDIK